jgi:hypothetical protein
MRSSERLAWIAVIVMLTLASAVGTLWVLVTYRNTVRRRKLDALAMRLRTAAGAREEKRLILYLREWAAQRHCYTEVEWLRQDVRPKVMITVSSFPSRTTDWFWYRFSLAPIDPNSIAPLGPEQACVPRFL